MTAPHGSGWRYYGWRIVGVAFVCHFVAGGFLFYSYGVFFKAVATEFGGSRLQVSLGLGLTSVVSACLAPFVGRLVERGRVRRIIIAGALVSACGFGAASFAQALWHYYALLSLIGGSGLVLLGGIAPATLVTSWFVERRGTALGIATMGVSLSGLVMPPAATWLIHEFGWRGGYRIYAIATILLVVPAAWFSVVDGPDGVPPEDAGRALPSTAGLLGDRTFWLLGVGFGLVLFALGPVLTHIVPHLTDRGVDPYRAAAMLSVMAGCGVIGKFGLGALADRTSPRQAAGLSVVLQLAALVALMRVERYELLVVTAALFGLGMGGIVPLQSLFVSHLFGARAFARTSGLLRPLMLPFTATGIPLGGWLFDRYGNYDVAWWTYAGAYVLGILCLATVRSRSQAQPLRAASAGSPRSS